ncbi:MAG: glycosyltransferase family 39 protein [Saprospiraceae bacterium]|nr:glycosyltransferase family 39 protein [Saprospiraceae bacterium]
MSKKIKAKTNPVAGHPASPSKPFIPIYLWPALLALVLYANTLGHGFALDDTILIVKNQFTNKGISGWGKIFSTDTFLGYYQLEGRETMITGGRYRPFSMAFFALIYQFFGAKPFVFHLFNVLLYAFSAVVVYKTLRTLLHRTAEESVFSIAFIATLLFVAHPVHTEVVANVKSADELFCLLFSLLSLFFVLKANDSGQNKWSRWAGLAFLCACFSKENALTFLAVIPLALWFFRSDDGRFSAGKTIRLLAFPLLGAVLFILVRGAVLDWKFGENANVLINNPFIKWTGANWVPFNFGERSAAIVYSMGKYLQLLLFPHPLTHDYYPRFIGLVTWSDVWVWLSAAAIMFIAYIGFKGLKQKSILSFSALYYGATLSIVSNIFFPIGTNMAERFVYMPSIAFCVALGYLFTRPKKHKLAWGLLAVILVLYSGKTVIRNRVWKDNGTLAANDIKTSANSAKLNNSYGAQLCQDAMKLNDPREKTGLTNVAIGHFNKALEINPDYIEAFYGRGSAWFIQGNFMAAAQDYLRADNIDPQFPNLKTNLVLALREAAKVLLRQERGRATAVQYLREAQRRYPNDPEINTLLAQYGQ